MTDQICGCCGGIQHQTPGEIANPPRLPEIRYRSGTHGDFLASMLAGLSSADRPTLSRLRTRDGDDPTIALLDAWAVSCDVLTFYTERLANESYLGTATDPVSLQEMGKLIGYRLNPGLAAETWLAFTMERPPPAVAGAPRDPGLLPAVVPSATTLPIGLRVQSIPGPGEQPQTFETVEAIEARPEWNVLPLATTAPHVPIWGRQDAWLAGAANNLAPGDVLLLASPDLVDDRWDVRVLTTVSTDVAADRTHVHWRPGLGSVYPPNDPAAVPDAYVLRKRFSVFGHNAPLWTSMPRTFRSGYLKTYSRGAGESNTEWPQYTSVTWSSGVGTVDLDGSHKDIAVGSWVVVSQEGDDFYRELYHVTAVAELSRAEYAISGTVTRLTLRGEQHDFGTPREVTVLAVAESLTIVEAPIDPARLLSSATLLVDGDATAMAAGRTVLLEGEAVDGSRKVQRLTIASVTKSGSRTVITPVQPPTVAVRQVGALVYGNVAHATHGETVQQLLGDGNGRVRFARYPLRFAPLTYVPADNPAGAQSSLIVRVQDVAWSERTSLYGAGPADRAYVTRTEADGTVGAGFGDGVHGALVPTGVSNVRATYRKGIGAAGNVAAQALAQPIDKPLGLKAVSNPAVAAGGIDPESAEHARVSMPLPVRTLGRAVSLRDYADFALAFTGIARASAVVLNLRGGRTIVVSVVGSDSTAPQATIVTRLAQALRQAGDPLAKVVVLAARSASFRLAAKIAVDPVREADQVLAAVREAVQARYGPGVRDLGVPVHRSAVIATMAAVPGVLAVDLDLLYRGAVPGTSETLVADPPHVDAAGDPVAAELLALANGDPFDRLEPM
jgi:predicted phage baseplate assembly protein